MSKLFKYTYPKVLLVVYRVVYVYYSFPLPNEEPKAHLLIKDQIMLLNKVNNSKTIDNSCYTSVEVISFALSQNIVQTKIVWPDKQEMLLCECSECSFHCLLSALSHSPISRMCALSQPRAKLTVVWLYSLVFSTFPEHRFAAKECRAADRTGAQTGADRGRPTGHQRSRWSHSQVSRYTVLFLMHSHFKVT